MTRIALALLALLAVAPTALAVPSWGAKTSRPADTVPAALHPGEWVWGGDAKAMGPMAVVVSLTEQRAYVYRNGLLVAVSTVSTGKPGHETPTGVFTILQKDKDHRSSKYNDAPMPFRWQPELAPTGVLSLLLSTTDGRLFAYRDGKEIGRARVGFGDGAA
ncbi:L,D-transpeptidase family protein [Stenotrophomonas rhizophila]